MTVKLPAPGPLDQVQQTAATLAALDEALAGASLDGSTRALLQSAHDSLKASSRDAKAVARRYHALFEAVRPCPTRSPSLTPRASCSTSTRLPPRPTGLRSTRLSANPSTC